MALLFVCLGNCVCTRYGGGERREGTCVGLRKQMALRCFMDSLPLLLSSSNRYTSFCSISDCEYTMLTTLI